MKRDDAGKQAAQPKIRVGISSCLLGQEVRFDGGHKRDSYINGTLSEYFCFVPVCPEVAVGLGTPREPIRLQGDPSKPRVVGVRSRGLDVTDDLESYGRKMAVELNDISGYILKRASPSCGMERVKVYGEQSGPSSKKGVGVYARAFMEHQPLLPVEEEGRLGDPGLRENFIERVFVFDRWRALAAGRPTAGRLVEFHTQHKFAVMAHSQASYQRLGRLVAQAGSMPLDAFADAYIAELMAALKRRANRRGHANVLMHLLGFLKRHLDGADKAEMLETIDAYRRGLVPLIVPITLLKHHFRRHPNRYIEGQIYLEPHPKELMLRNLV